MVSAFDEIQAVLDEVSRDEQKTLLAFAKDRGYRVTSGFSHGGHNKGSKHYQGTEQDPMAIDIDHRGVNHQDLMAAAQAAGYRVLDERQRPAGQAVWGGPHYHLEKIAQAVAQQKPVVAQNAITQSNTFSTPAPQLVNRGPLLQQDEYGVLRRTGNYNTPQYTRSKVDTGSTIAQPKQPKKTVNYFSDIEQILADANQPKPPTPENTSVGFGQGIANLGGAVAGGIGNLFSAATNPQTYVDLGNAAGKALQTEFSTPVNRPTERIEAVGLGALKGARDLAQGLINLFADIGNAYMGREVYTPGLGGVNFELPQVQSELLDKRPVSSFLGQSVPYMIPVGEAAAAVRGGKAAQAAVNTGKGITLAEKGARAKQIARGLGKSVAEGAVLDFISNPEGGGLEGRILNTGAGAALATGLGAGGGVLLRNADRMGRARDIGEVNLQSILGQEERAAAQQGLDQINRERQVTNANEGAFLQPSDNDLNTVQQILDAREQENQLLNQRIRDLNEAYQARTRQPGGEVITQPFDETQAMRDLGMREGVTERVGDTDLVVAREGAKRPRPDIEIDRSPYKIKPDIEDTQVAQTNNKQAGVKRTRADEIAEVNTTIGVLQEANIENIIAYEVLSRAGYTVTKVPASKAPAKGGIYYDVALPYSGKVRVAASTPLHSFLSDINKKINPKTYNQIAGRIYDSGEIQNIQQVIDNVIKDTDINSSLLDEYYSQKGINSVEPELDVYNKAQQYYDDAYNALEQATTKEDADIAFEKAMAHPNEELVPQTLWNRVVNRYTDKIDEIEKAIKRGTPLKSSRDIALDRAQRMGQEPVRDLGDVTRLDQPTRTDAPQRPIDLAQPKPETRPLDLGQPQRSDTPLLDAQGRPLNRDLGATDSPSLVRDLAEITQPRQDIIQPPRDTGKATLPESGNVSRIGDAEVFTHGQDANVIKEQLQALQNNQEQLASIAAVEEHLKQVAPDASPYMRDIVQAGSEGQTVKFTYEPREAPGTIREREFAPGAFTLQKIKPNTERSFLRRQFNNDDQAIIQHLTQRINEAGGTVNAADLQTKAGSPRKTANQINTLIQKLDEVMGGRYLQSPRIHGLNVGADSTRGGLDVNRNRGIRLDSIRSTQLTGSAVTPEGIQNIGGASEYANQIKPAMSAIRELASAQGAPREFKRIANQLSSGNITSKTVADMRKLFAELPEQAQALCNILGMG